MTDPARKNLTAGRRLFQVLLTEQSTGDDEVVFKTITGTAVEGDGFLSIVIALKLSVFLVDYLLRLAFPDDEIRDRFRQDWFAGLEGMTE